MNSCVVAVLIPVWVGIAFNLTMTVANFAIPYRSGFGRWYFEKSGGEKLMFGGWAVFIAWAIFNAVTC